MSVWSRISVKRSDSVRPLGNPNGLSIRGVHSWSRGGYSSCRAPTLLAGRLARGFVTDLLTQRSFQSVHLGLTVTHPNSLLSSGADEA